MNLKTLCQAIAQGFQTSRSDTAFGRMRFSGFNPIWLGYGLVGFGVILSAIMVRLNPPLAHLWERQIQVFFTERRGFVKPPPEVVILAIDDESINQREFYNADPNRFGYLEPLQVWPWRRVAYAQAIEKLMAAGARTVTLDVIFSSPSSHGLEDDRQLQRTLQRYAGKVTLAMHYSYTTNQDFSNLHLELPVPQLQTQPLSLGLLNLLTDLDGRVYLMGSQYADIVAAEQGLERQKSLAEATLSAAGISYPPPRGQGIFFYGPRNTFRTIPFWHVLDPETWRTLYQDGRFFQNKIVLIGPTVTDMQDFHRTAFADQVKLPGVEIHANAIATLMENRSITELWPDAQPRSVAVLILLSLAGLGICYTPRRGLWPLLTTLGLCASWLIVSFCSLTLGYTVLPTAVPVLCLLVAGLSYFAATAVSDQLEKSRLRRTLERYVSRAVVREILSQPEDFQAMLQGRKLKAAVLFCDIRGFTTLSYRLPAEQLVAQLNEYLSAMVEVIIQERGTIDKYIGDAIMAEFGSPVSQGEKQDAMSAIRAALAMRKRLVELRQHWQANQQVPFFNGIGISYGEVIAGNIGSIQRSEYTVIGDSVNIASRVEGLTKELGTDLLITKSLYDLVWDEVEAVYMGEHPLRGRGSTVQLYSVLAMKGEDTSLYYEVQDGLRQGQEELKKMKLIG